jgi:hypothetical protein
MGEDIVWKLACHSHNTGNNDCERELLQTRICNSRLDDTNGRYHVENLVSFDLHSVCRRDLHHALAVIACFAIAYGFFDALVTYETEEI